MTPEKWERLLSRSRNHVARWGGRVRVRAFELPPWSAERVGTRWAYTWDCLNGCPCSAEPF
jgi:hypothetical protein